MATKTNPNNFPLKKNAFNQDEIIRQITVSMSFKAWLLILNSYANFSEASKENMLKLWEDVNAYGTTVQTYDDIEAEIKYISDITGMKLGFENLSRITVSTQGDLKRFKRKVERNAFSTALAIVRNQLLPEDDIAILFKRALLTNESLLENSIQTSDLQAVLMDEFDLILHQNGKTVYLSQIDQTSNA